MPLDFHSTMCNDVQTNWTPPEQKIWLLMHLLCYIRHGIFGDRDYLVPVALGVLRSDTIATQ